MFCPHCGKELELNDYPPTGTSVDMYEGKCENGHIFEISIELQDGLIKLTQLETSADDVSEM